MRPIFRLVLGVVALVAILAGVAVSLPNSVHIARTIVINAPETAIFPYLNDVRQFASWSPWAQRDPKIRIDYSGVPSGKGAHMEWYSEVPSVGAGSVDITDSEKPTRVDLDVDYDGMEGTSYLLISPSGSGSKVTWGYGYETGNNLLKRWQGLMLDRFVGTEYQQGLVNLKQVVETERRPEESVIQREPAPNQAAPVPQQ